MSFLHLYKHIEALAAEAALMQPGAGGGYVSVEVVRNAIIERDYAKSIEIFAADLDENVSLGHIVVRDFREDRYEEDETSGLYAKITFDQKRNTCWARFVACKEMMHLFDDPDEVIDSKAKFIKLLQEIEAKPPERSKAMDSEYRAEWMALLILCPKPERDRMKALLDANEMSPYEVALHFRIPERFVPPLMGDFYDQTYAALITAREEPPLVDPNEEPPLFS